MFNIFLGMRKTQRALRGAVYTAFGDVSGIFSVFFELPKVELFGFPFHCSLSKFSSSELSGMPFLVSQAEFSSC